MQARNKLSAIIGERIANLRVKAELNEVNILLHLVRSTDIVTILTEATLHGHTGIKAIPLNITGSDMAGCVHVLKNSYRKHSASEFLKLLSESNAVRQRVSEWL